MNKAYIQSWIDIAIEDLEISLILYENKKYSNSFYHFQQASEKGLKAYAFMVKTYTSEKDANHTGHYTLKVFVDSANERQKEIAFLKDYEFEKIIGIENLDEYSNNLEDGLKSLPQRKEIFEYSNDILHEILKTICELSEYNFELPNGFKEHLIEKMDLIFDLIYKLNPDGYSAAKVATIPTQSTPPIPLQRSPRFRWKGIHLFRSKVRHFTPDLILLTD